MSHSSDPDVRASLSEYQEIALRTWIPEGMGNPDSIGLKAAHLLADLLKEHGDTWLNDFLKAIQPGDITGLQKLGAAITNNKRGFHNAGGDEAERAAKIFSTRNAPGALRARFEIVYAGRRLLKKQSCLDDIQSLKRDLRGTSYRWLQIQTILQEANCLHSESKSDEADKLVETAFEEAKNADYPWLELRALAFRSGMAARRNTDPSRPDDSPGWQEAMEGLEQYWKSSRSPDRLYELLSMMKTCLQSKKLWYAARAFQEQMIRELEQETDPADRNPVLEATAHSALSGILQHLDDLQGAEREAEIALTIARTIPLQEEAIHKFQVPIKLDIAGFQLERNNAEAAEEILKDIKRDVDEMDDAFIRLKFWRVQGDVRLSLKKIEDAAASYKVGIKISEEVLADLKGEKRARWTTEAGELYRGMIAVFLRQNNKEQALRLWEWYRTRARETQEAALQQQHEISWNEIEQQISAVPLPLQQTGMRLVYSYIKGRLYIWTIQGTDIRTFSSVIRKKDLDEMVIKYSQKCSTPMPFDLSAFERESRDLFTVLLQPVSALLQRGTLVAVEMDPAVNGVSLETLKTPEGSYFGQKYPIIYSPGWMQEADLRSPAKAEQGIFLNAQPREIPEIQGLKKTIQDLHPGIQSMDPSAIEAWRKQLANSEILIFFGHGKPHGLIYAGNQVLQAQQFPAEALSHLQIAALMACSTRSAGDGFLRADDLVNAFITGGTPTVIASNWNVDSRIPAQFTAVFLTAIQHGKTAANAVFEARKSIFSDYPQPYYWAAFSITGKAN